MASSDKDVEEQLLEAGNKIVDPPTSVDELLPLLDKIESLLAKVEQSPSKSMQSALTPSLKALVSDQLLRHLDIDVKVAVAACISEITRITAPDAPYNDDQMKEIFHLIVSSFENLSDKSSRSYAKRSSILETVAKVRSCVVMLDLECDGLIVEMFQHFLKTVRDYHPENVFTSMETIMSLVLEESEDISVELLSPILDSVKIDNEEILPISRKLGERVLDSCATKLKPYLVQVVKTLGISFDDYSDVVASICKDLSGSLEQSNLHAAGENVVSESKSVRTSGDEVEEKPTEVATPERVDTAIEKHHGSVKSNGVAQEGEDGSVSNLENKKEEHDGHECKEVKSPKSSEPSNLGSEKATNVKERSEKTSKKRGRKSNQSLKSIEVPHVDAHKGSESQPEHESHSADRSPENLPSENEVDAKPSSPKAIEFQSANVASPSLSGSIPDECNTLKSGQAKKKDNSAIEAASSAEVSKKPSEGVNDLGAKPSSHAEEEAPAADFDDTKIAAEDAAARESDATSDSEAKVLKHSLRKGDGSSKSGGGSLKQLEAKRKKASAADSDDTKAAGEDAAERESDATSDSEAKVLKHSLRKGDGSSKSGAGSLKQLEAKRKKAPAADSDDTKTAAEDAAERESDATSDSEAKVLKRSVRKGDGSSKSGGGSLKQSDAKRKKAPAADSDDIKTATEDAAERESDATSDSEAKPLKQSLRKGDVASKSGGGSLKQSETKKKKAHAVDFDDTKTATEDAAERESDATSDSEAKPLKQSLRKGDGANKSGGGSLKQSDAKRKKGLGKSISGKTVKKLTGDDDKKETTPVLKPTSKSTKDEKMLDKTTTPASKRKRTPSKEKGSETKDLDETLVGSKIKVWWPKDRKFYEGVVDSFDPEKKKHKVLYMDGDEEILNLKKERWEFVDEDSESEREQTADLDRSESAAEIPQKKKAKLNANESAKRGKIDSSPKKGGVTSSSKSKVAATKTDRSSGSKVEVKPKENTPKVGRPTTVTGSKSKDQTTPKTGTGSKASSTGPKIVGKSRNDDAESHKTGKSKDDETSTPAASAKSKQQDVLKMGKSKQETPKPPAISKGKSPKTGDKSNSSNLSTKVKFTSSKSKESGDLKNLAASEKSAENSKGKSLNPFNDQGNDSKLSGKKRRKESKG